MLRNTGVNGSSGEHTSMWAPRDGHACLALGERLLVLGGMTQDGLQNDVWSSQDGGMSWSCLCSAASWPRRSGHAVVALPGGDMLLLGGFTEGNRCINDAWTSQDGGKNIISIPWWHTTMLFPHIENQRTQPINRIGSRMEEAGV